MRKVKMKSNGKEKAKKKEKYHTLSMSRSVFNKRTIFIRFRFAGIATAEEE